MYFALYIVILAIFAAALVVRGIQLVERGAIVRAYTELTTPLLIFAMYGVFGIGNFFPADNSWVTTRGITFGDRDIFYAFFILFIAALFYWIGAASGRYPPSMARTPRNLRPPLPRLQTTGILIVLTGLDLVSRLQEIRAGVYFTWMRGRAADLYDVHRSDLWLLTDKLPPIIFVLAAILMVRNRKWLLFVLGYLFLMVLAGNRTPMFHALISFTAAYLHFHPSPPSFSKLLRIGVVTLLVMAFISSVVIEIRKDFRSNISGALADPVNFIVDVATVYVPNAAISVITGNDGQEEEHKGVASASERLSLMVSSFASQLYALRNGKTFLPRQQFFDEAVIWIPSAIYIGRKPPQNFGLRTNQHLGLTETDPATSLYSSFYLHLGLAGVAVFAFFVGCIASLYGTLLSRMMGGIGAGVWIGSIEAFKATTNSFGSLFASLRDYTLILILVWIVYQILSVRWSRSARLAR